MSKVQDLLLSLVGANRDVLQRCRGEQPKLVAMGALIVVTGTFAFCSALFVLLDVMHVVPPVAVVFASGWSAAIMSLDRYFVMAIRRDRSQLRTIMLTLPRVLVAFVAGAVIALFLVLLMFSPEVMEQANEDKVLELRAAQLAFDHKYAEVGQLESRVAALGTADTSTGDGLASNGAYESVAQEASHLHEQERSARAAAAAELGGFGGSHHAGAGPVYEADFAQAQKLHVEAEAASARMNALRSSLLGEESRRSGEIVSYANTEREKLSRRLAALRAERTVGEKRLAKEGSAPIGLADRMDALTRLGEKHPPIGHLELLLTLLLLAVDSSPAVMKTLMVMGPPCLYEHELEQDEAATKDRNDYRRAIELERDRLACDEEADIHHIRGVAAAAKIESQRPLDEAKLAQKGWLNTIKDAMDSVTAGEAARIRRMVDRHNEIADEQFDQRLADAKNAKPEPPQPPKRPSSEAGPSMPQPGRGRSPRPPWRPRPGRRPQA
jgi:hypothetical protein